MEWVGGRHCSAFFRFYFLNAIYIFMLPIENFVLVGACLETEVLRFISPFISLLLVTEAAVRWVREGGL